MSFYCILNLEEKPEGDEEGLLKRRIPNRMRDHVKQPKCLLHQTLIAGELSTYRLLLTNSSTKVKAENMLTVRRGISYHNSSQYFSVISG